MTAKKIREGDKEDRFIYLTFPYLFVNQKLLPFPDGLTAFLTPDHKVRRVIFRKADRHKEDKETIKVTH